MSSVRMSRVNAEAFLMKDPYSIVTCPVSGI